MEEIVSSENSKLEEVRRLRLIDVSSEDDCLIGSPCVIPFVNLALVVENQMEQDYFDMSAIGNTLEEEDSVDLFKEMEQDGLLFKPLVQERTRKDAKCNLRKSLAWDSAFFTSAGVLDPDELSTIHCGLKKTDASPLPGILEDVRRSAESNSTLDSDNFTLENVEVGLFDDIRASIQKSSKAANVANHSGKAIIGESGIQTSRKIGVPPRNRAVPKIGESSSLSHKPPKIIAKVDSSSAVPTKRTSMGTNRPTIGAGRRQPVILDKPNTSTSTSSPKSSSDSSPSVNKMKSAVSIAPHSRSGSNSSDSSGKPPLKSLKNRLDSRDPKSSSSSLRAPLKAPSKSKTDLRNARLSAYLSSVSKNNSISPASSIDGWSTGSSSSTSTINPRSSSSKKIVGNTSPHKGFSLESEMMQSLHAQTHPCGERESEGTKRPSECDKKESSTSAAISNTISKDVSRSFKPSGLRMPSPKIGFFDPEKSMMCTPSRGLRSNYGSSSPKSGAESSKVSGGTIKEKLGKYQSSRTPNGTGGNGLDARKSGTRLSPLSTRHSSVQTKETSSVPSKLSSRASAREGRDGKYSKPKNDDASHIIGPVSEPKSQEVEDANKDSGSIDSILNVKNSSQDSLNADIDIERGAHIGNEITHAEGAQLSGTAASGSHEDVTGSEASSQVTQCVQDEVESKLNLRHESIEKEDQIDTLSRHVGSIDLNMDELN
ncbi:hypothetical protein Sjap_001616 [Stephania japonica]|uniref:Uncharacterized protein n=1 Tax=Stephania japonica TaxID=461633 RepID=A0AAP0PV80_9MAGN